MAFNVIPTASFIRAAKPLMKKYPSLRADIKDLADSLVTNPTQGILIARNCYKIRIAISSKARGKSGGARVITNIHIDGDIVYLLLIFDKSDRDNISDYELGELLSEIGEEK